MKKNEEKMFWSSEKINFFPTLFGWSFGFAFQR
jgi:hypothetical protein